MRGYTSVNNILLQLSGWQRLEECAATIRRMSGALQELGGHGAQFMETARLCIDACQRDLDALVRQKCVKLRRAVGLSTALGVPSASSALIIFRSTFLGCRVRPERPA